MTTLTPGTYYRHRAQFSNGSRLLHYTVRGELYHIYHDGRRVRSEWTPRMVELFLEAGHVVPVSEP